MGAKRQTGVLCDENGKVAICRECETDLHSPYWTASKSAHLHRRGTGHRVDVVHASSLFESD